MFSVCATFFGRAISREFFYQYTVDIFSNTTVAVSFDHFLLGNPGQLVVIVLFPTSLRGIVFAR